MSLLALWPTENLQLSYVTIITQPRDVDPATGKR